MEFDKNKVLTCVTGGTEWIGKKGWFANSIPQFINKINDYAPHVLLGFESSSVYPFVYDEVFRSALFYPAPTHAECQAEWVKEHNIQVGTKVRITRDFGRDEEAGTFGHSGVAGTTGKVWHMGPRHINVIYDHDGELRTTPYYVIEVIKEPTYRPYNNDELNSLVGKVLTNKYTGYNKLVTEQVANIAVRVGDSDCTAKDLFHYFTLDGKPCGVRGEA